MNFRGPMGLLKNQRRNLLDSKVFYDSIRKSLFNGKLTEAKVQGIEGILSAMNRVGDGDIDTLAYALASAYHETGSRMVPVREGFATTDAGARRAVNNLAAKRGPNSSVAKYAKPTGPYGHVYYGRGHVQLTWMENYERSSADAGVDLVKNPDAMLDPEISARVLIRGLMDGRWNGQGKGIDFYEGEDDFLNDAEAAEARRTVNVKDKATLIAGYHRKFYNALKAAGWKATNPKPVVKPSVPTPSKPEATAKPQPDWFAWFVELIKSLFRGK
jgi:Chitinase class I